MSDELVQLLIDQIGTLAEGVQAVPCRRDRCRNRGVPLRADQLIATRRDAVENARRAPAGVLVSGCSPAAVLLSNRTAKLCSWLVFRHISS